MEISEYDYGFRIRDILKREGLISSKSKVLDIGAGPGSLTIPVAEIVDTVVVIEPAKEMVKYLLNNALKRNITNIKIINKRWEEVDISKIEGEFDLALCSNVLQLFRDVDNQLLRIGLVSDCCCVAMSIYYEFEGYRICRCPYFICLYNIIKSLG